MEHGTECSLGNGTWDRMECREWNMGQSRAAGMEHGTEWGVGNGTWDDRGCADRGGREDRAGGRKIRRDRGDGLSGLGEGLDGTQGDGQRGRESRAV